jgi:DNA-binding PadR family transcriptional regulator
MSFKTDLEALILGVLQSADAHGYEIAKRIKSISETALSVGEGQLYPALHALERDGFVSATWIPQEGKPDRKVYSLTEAGRGALREKRKAWAAFAESVSAILSPQAAKEQGIG